MNILKGSTAVKYICQGSDASVVDEDLEMAWVWRENFQVFEVWATIRGCWYRVEVYWPNRASISDAAPIR